MIRIRNYKKLLLLFCLITLITNFNTAKAFEKSDRLGSFSTKSLQELLEKPFYLFANNKGNTIPFFLKDFIDWDYQMVYDVSYISEIENPFGDYSENILEKLYLELGQTYQDKLHYKKNSTIFIKEMETKLFLDSISKKINRDPIDGKFKMNENNQLSILEESQEGLQLKVSGSYEIIKKSIIENPQSLYIPLVVIENLPAISTNNPDEYQIKKLIGTGKSDFTGSSQTRIHNIKTAAKRFNGLIIKPEEEFSFTTILGEVDESTGYKEELVIKKNQTVPEYGGGICQLSTTMFRAALNTGLKITERHNHSYPVHYYNPPGTDATVYVPKPDLKIKNNTSDYLLIQTRIDEPIKKFYINFYSKEDLFDVELIGPEVVEKTSEGNLRTTLKQIVKNKDGKEIFQEIFNSFYDNPDNYPSPSQIILEKPKDWSGKQWDEYYTKFGSVIEEIKKNN